MRIGFGCVNLGSAARGHSPRADVRLVQEAVDRGIDLFDTADVYGSGASERILGRGLGPRRDGVTIATKGGYRFRPRSAAEQTARRMAMKAQKAIRRGGGGHGGGGTGGSYEAAGLLPRSPALGRRMPACAGCAPTTSTCTSCTGPTSSRRTCSSSSRTS